MKLENLKAGDTVILDGGFTCVDAGPTVLYSEDGDLYFMCKEGGHMVAGQIGHDDHLVGISRGQ